MIFTESRTGPLYLCNRPDNAKQLATDNTAHSTFIFIDKLLKICPNRRLMGQSIVRGLFNIEECDGIKGK